MGLLPTGPSSAHILKSHGADININKFYTTQNSTTYGKFWQKFKPRVGHHYGTGYASNFRPQIYYTTKLDEIDNPTLGKMCSQNYHSLTELSFQPYNENNGEESLLNSVYRAKTGFVQQKPLHVPTDAEIKKVFIDGRLAASKSSILPNCRPLLHTLQSKDPAEHENNGYGPTFMKSETKEMFRGSQAPHDYDIKYMSVGPLTETGFTHAYNVEPISFNPNDDHAGDKPDWQTTRPTGISVNKTNFRPWMYSKRSTVRRLGVNNPVGFLPSSCLQGDDKNHGIRNPSERGSGFTHNSLRPLFVHKHSEDAYDKAEAASSLKLVRTKKNDPMEYLNMEHINNYTSTHKGQFRGQQAAHLSLADKLNRTMCGFKELSGHSRNGDRFVKVPDDIGRFTTHYTTRYQDATLQGLDRMGHTWGGVHKPKPDGFTSNSNTHCYGPVDNSVGILRGMEPYQARSVKARDAFYDDHKHDEKRRMLASVA